MPCRDEDLDYEDVDVDLVPICEVGITVTSDAGNDLPQKAQFLSLRQRRQMKLGIQKVLPLNVLIPHATVNNRNKKWYEALKKVWGHQDPWQSFHLNDYPEQQAIRHRYNPLKQKWYKDPVKVKMETESFSRGAMRQCYRLKKLSKFTHSENWDHAGNYVAKRYLESVDRSVYFEDVKLQMDAKLWAEDYNRHNPPKKIDIFQMYIIELVNQEGSPLYHLEHFIEGDYIKYNSNSGFVEDTKTCRYTPQAFSHFTFERSGHELIVVDIQGVGDLYTDPQIHTSDGLQYGDGNLGTKGMSLFFHTHECNEICKAMKLTPFDLSESEKVSIMDHRSSACSSETSVKPFKMEHVISPTPDERHDLHRMLSHPRLRSYSSMSETGSQHDDEIIPTSPDDKSALDMQLSTDSGIHPENLHSVSSQDTYPYDTPSDYSSSVPSNSASFTKSMEQRLYGLRSQMMRGSSVDIEITLQKEQDSGDSVLGQVHHELAKYHEIGRFIVDGDEKSIDWESAMFHEEIAAKLGVAEAVITMSKLYLGIPRDVLVNCNVPATQENVDKGVEYMCQAANVNDRQSILYMAKAYQTGIGLGSVRERSYALAVEYYAKAIQTLTGEDAGDFDATMHDPNYLLLAAQAELYLQGGFGLEQDSQRAGELFTEAAEEASAAMKGRLANQYFMKAEEAWSQKE